MDFPKKQAQRLMPLYLLEYSEKLFTNHPNPEDPWGGGGSDYTAGQGITITNNEISVDTNVIATKSDISSMVTTTQLNDALDDYALKTEIPTDVSQLYNDAGYATETWVQNQGYLPSDSLRDVYKAEAEISSGQYKVFPHYSGIEYSKEFEDKRLTIKLEDIDNGNHPTVMLSEQESTYIYPGHVDAVSSDKQTFTQMDFNEFKVNTNGGINLTTFRQGGIDYNNIHFNLNSNKQELENYTIATLDDIPSLSGYATESWVQNQGYATSSSLSTVATTGSYNDLTDKPAFATVATSGSYNDLTDKPYIFPSSRIVDIDTNQNITGIKTFEGSIRVKHITGAQITSILPDTFDYTSVNPVTREKSRTKFNLPISKPKGTEDTPTEYTLATTDDIPSLTGYATETWVQNQGYATSSEVPTTATSTSTSTVTPTTIELVFTYEDNTTQTITLMTGATVSTSTTTTLS